jgi:biotin-dependent carboxylase-like uncharacterized protein
MSIKILNPGVQALVQDGGRFGMARCGVPVSGAFDRRSWQSANEIVGNTTPGPFDSWPGPAAIEVLLGGLRLEATADVIVAVTGADVPVTLLDVDDDDKRDVSRHEPILLTAGSRLHLGNAKSGLRAYVGIAGGIDVDPTLESRSTDTTSNLGPHPLAKGAVLKVGWIVGQPKSSLDGRTVLPGSANATIVRFRPNPGVEATSTGILSTGPIARSWLVSPNSSRAGVRLIPTDQQAGSTRTQAMLASAPAIPGALQQLPDGELVVIGPDGPTTGGYPVVAVFDRDELDIIAQARPGTMVQLAPIDD